MTGLLTWLGDMNWWDVPPLETNITTPARITHTLLGFGLLMLFGSIYWHSKMHWQKATQAKKLTGLLLWLILVVLIIGALMLLYSTEAQHTLALWLHVGTGLLLMAVVTAHLKAKNNRAPLKTQWGGSLKEGVAKNNM
jgi:cell division protein FtsW (lipid II flippase)